MRSAMIAAGIVLLAGCAREPAPTPASAEESGSLATAPVTLATADTATVELPLSLPSQLYVEHDAPVFARSEGVVVVILADLGTAVAAGQELARLESVDQEIALAQAQEKARNTALTLDRQRALTTAGVATKADSEQVEFEHRQAELALRKAERDLELTRIVAPFAGVVTARAARVQRLVSPGDTLFRVTAAAPILAAVHVPEGPAGNLRVGSTAEVLGPGGASARARVVRASPFLDPASGTREVVLQLAPGTGLTPGSSVTVRLGSQQRQVVTIPRGAITKEGHALVWEDNRTTLRAVTLGSAVGEDRVEVVSGLAPGEKVVSGSP